MIERSITVDEILMTLENGEIIENYGNDKPYPSKLIFKLVDKKPIHVVCAETVEEKIIITVYEPTLDKWKKDFKIRKKL